MRPGAKSLVPVDVLLMGASQPNAGLSAGGGPRDTPGAAEEAPLERHITKKEFYVPTQLGRSNVTAGLPRIGLLCKVLCKREMSC